MSKDFHFYPLLFAWYFIFVEYFLEIMTRRVQWWMGVLTKPVPSKGTQGTNKDLCFFLSFCNFLYQGNILLIKRGPSKDIEVNWTTYNGFLLNFFNMLNYFQANPSQDMQRIKTVFFKKEEMRPKREKAGEGKGRERSWSVTTYHLWIFSIYRHLHWASHKKMQAFYSR